ncbi:hypothetical protein [Streptomyces sp. NPDC049040]|uniref:Rv1733c family protein n=1 Tax=Streptomyces sp. NPDC049040 TaxID=3365593 RepID=UPI003719AF22
MARPKRLTKSWWRWRRNPLRRRSDVVEAWLGAVTALLLCTAPLIGWWAGQSVDRTLHRVARDQRAQRSLVPAAVVESPAAPGTTAAPGAAKAAAATAGTDPRHGDMLHWIAPDRSPHTAKVPAGLEVWRGDSLLLWTDRTGVLVPPPLDDTTASTHAVLAGVAAGSAAGGALLMSRQLLVWRLMRRRMDSWEREWAAVGQDWGRAGADG